MTPRAIPPGLAPKIASLYADPHAPRCAAVTTGGGAALGQWLVGTPGASSVVLDFQLPYIQSSLTQYLGGHEPKRYCSAETAALMSQRALCRAKELWLSNNNGDLRSLVGNKFVGLGATAAIVSTAPKRGEHRAFVACATDEGTRQLGLAMKKGARDRVGEDEMVSRLLLRSLLSSSGDLGADWNDALEDTEVVTEDFIPNPDPLETLLSGKAPAVSCVLFLPANSKEESVTYPNFVPQTTMIVYPGSFNPLHQGHIELAKAAQRSLTAKDVGGSATSCPPLAFEISAANPDKPTLSKSVLVGRIEQFDSENPVIVTKAPLFLEKARLMPNCAFVVGADTATRILNKKYYSNSETEMVLALSEMKHLGASFLVGGRKVGDTFLTLQDILAPLEHLPASIREMFVEIPSFRVDLSSSEIRAKSIES